METGCLRALNWEGDGCSSILFDDFAKRTGSRFISIDKDPAHCALARRHCPRAQVLCGDSVATLYRLRQRLQQVDFLYLDSYDVDWNNPHPSALHHLKELCAAAPLLGRGAIVFIDDNTDSSGKALYVKSTLTQHRCKTSLCGLPDRVCDAVKNGQVLKLHESLNGAD